MKKVPCTGNALDESVILTMLVCAVLGLFITSYKYINAEPCVTYPINTSSANYYTGEVVKLSTTAINPKGIIWNFGDSTREEAGIKSSVVHTYDKPGEYTVTLTVNKTCIQTKTIKIQNAPPVIDLSKTPEFTVPEKIIAGVPFTIWDSSRFANTWEWRFGETAVVDATTAMATYTYKTPGLKTITLVVNGNTDNMGVAKVLVNEAKISPSKAVKNKDRRSSPQVFIVDKKPESENILKEDKLEKPVEEEAVYPNISTSEIETMLKQVADKKISEQYFETYFCNLKIVPVTVNGTAMSFNTLYKNLTEINGSNKIKSFKAQMVKNKKTNCVEGLNIWMKTKGKFLGINW
ncbi:MAG: PKD domain-containing protein [Chitinophagaceae bacterium]|nr:PKD domain-containing protein [Chitinophagaceae bacterium]